MGLVNVHCTKFNINIHCLHEFKFNKICTFFKMHISLINNKIIIGTKDMSDSQYFSYIDQ